MHLKPWKAFKQYPDIEVAILDINLPDISSIALTQKIWREFPHIKVLAMSTFNERSYISQMIQNGASGYLVKSASKEEIENLLTKFDVNNTAGLIKLAAKYNMI